ncbi:Rieske (2Fe-2S) protein [Pseudonocardia acidicola]|uniref:Rieske 2Fe-2S domain-containing protein n=1 Tax=Pseudonocardia acidicola TaxID=2724939 RepID=A0ABX1S6A3_9PSEU|nr:Rieske 2Fe-2S domain-containing protein [Pseudonocardia acidicola]NMH97105.1 Rieske 2Fe-2S domain-containing protein [Pseudonocardia acidicola]
MQWHRAAPSAEVGRDLRRVEIAGRAVLVGRTADGDPIATDPICPHQNRPMDGAAVYGDEIDCPHHHYTYDAHTGENRYPKRVFPRARAAAVQPIRVFPAREDAGWVWVGLVD